MLPDVVLQDTRPEEWPEIRERIFKRVTRSMGTAPDVNAKPQFDILLEYEKYGLKHQKIRYEVLPGEHGLAVIVHPKGCSARNPVPAVMICHGTYGWQYGKYGPLCLERLRGPYGQADHGYAIELAQRGFATVVPDNYKCGELLTGGERHASEEWLPFSQISEEEYRVRRKKTVEQFAKDYPDWSMDGRRVLHHRRLLDVMDKLDFLQHDAYGVMGHSLGGRMTMFLSALDERIVAGVPTCGVSPNVSNTAPNQHDPLKPPAHMATETASWFPYDYQDLIALNAPRPLLVVEPFNDTYRAHLQVNNAANFECYLKGQQAYALLGKPECFTILTHGDGHDTLSDVRIFAYLWFERWLLRKS